MLSRAISLESLVSSIGSLLLSFFTFSRSFFRAASSSLTCLPNDSCIRLLVRTSPSNLPIRDRISARSISQALRSRSCRCHSVCRKRITPIGEGGIVSFEKDQYQGQSFPVPTLQCILRPMGLSAIRRPITPRPDVSSTPSHGLGRLPSHAKSTSGGI